MRRVTIQMIAEKAGVSRGTVDRVLHDRPNVNPVIREQVQMLIRQLGYGSEEKPVRDRQIAAILPGGGWFNEELKKKWLTGIDDAKKIVGPLGISVKVVECDTDLPNEIAEKVELLKRNGLDGLMISAKNNPAMCKLIGELTSSGIPVVTYNSDLPNSGRLCFVGQNLNLSGRVAANLITKYIKAQGKILVVVGNLEINAHKQRVSGFVEKCKAFGIREDRIMIRESFNDYALTYEKVAEALRAERAIQAIYMANESISACVEAVDHNRAEKNLMIVGNDLTTVSKRLLQSEKVDFIIDQDIYRQGYQPIILLKNLFLSPETIPQQFQFTNIDIINAENIR